MAGRFEDLLDALDTESAKPGNEGARKQLEGPVAFYRGVCQANLDHSDKAREAFADFLRELPNASIDRGMYSKKAVAAFEEARKSVAASGETASGASSLATAYGGFRITGPLADQPTRNGATARRGG